MSFHSSMIDGDNHSITAKTYADETARDADSDWQITANINKIVKITDIDAYQVLVSVGATVWQTIAGGNLGDVDLDSITVGATIDVVGNIGAASYDVNALQAAPSSSTDTGYLGEIRWTLTHIYLCTATNVWVRAAIVTW